MPWAKFDDRFPSNRKIRLLSDGAFRLYVSAVCWSAESLTDGIVKTAELRLVSDVKAARTRAQELVDAGLWEPVDGVGWRIHDYHEYNPTADQVRADRAAKTARQKRWRDKVKGEPEAHTPPADAPDVDASTDASHDASRNGGGDAAPTRPDPTRTPTSGEGRERDAGSSARGAQALSQIPSDWKPDEQHRQAAAADMRRLGAAAVRSATDKFIRHHQSRGTRATDYGPLWVTWLSHERPDTGTQGTFLVGLAGGATTPTPPTLAERMAELDARIQAEDADRQRRDDTA